MLKWLGRIGLSLLAAVLLLALAGWWLLHGSLAQRDGTVLLAGLGAPAIIARDAQGTVTIDAANEADAARALGYVHAQERYFEMDLMRRLAAGELAELFGPVALDTDKQHRAFRLRERLAGQLDAFAGEHGAALQAYADGVNAGLAALKVRPWPYLLLRQHPRPWQIADSALTGYAMYFDLQDSRDGDELAWWKIAPHLPPALYALLRRDGTEWDAPLFGAARGNATLPTAAEVDLRQHQVAASSGPIAPWHEPNLPGSNNWAVDGTLTADGRAIVANDMHLGLRVPNIWFRARLRYPDPRAPGGKVDVAGFTLPGMPVVVVGSNGHIAWGFTDSYVDTADWVSLPKDDASIHEHDATIAVAGRAPEQMKLRESDWGPILEEDDERALALRWVAQLPGAMNAGIADLAWAGDLDAAFRVADGAGMPTQNFMVADSAGRIGWRLIGARAVRSGDCDAATVANAPCADWSIQSSAAPQLVDPPTHRLWTANNRILDGAALHDAGDMGYALGARARQVRDDLQAGSRFTEPDLLAIQLDDRTLFLERWWQLLQSERGKGKALDALAAAASHWDGHASPASVSYRIVRGWRLAVEGLIADGLLAPARTALGGEFRMPSLLQLEGVAWPLLEQRPPHLLAPRFADWDALLEEAAQTVSQGLGGPDSLAVRSWGEHNTAAICHPLASALPGPIGRRLCMPRDELAGDSNMPRVVAPDFGASERMVVSPGHEADGIIEMPGGQSDHPLSPYWGAGHAAWVKGEATPFLPGATRDTLRLAPR